ncbi:hypothetical protein Bra5_PB00343 (plasmid) [Rhizobium phaseoli Brasil 5]|nr:hypothetical protein Bra5_PB00343 [Rhizobium phaseoli Brasil 5]
MCGLFLKVHPRPRSQAPSALRLIFTCRSTDKRSTISSSVTSLRSLINATTNSSCASTAEGRLQLCGRAVNSPSFALQSSGSPSKSQLRNEPQPVEPTCPPQTLSKPVLGDHRSGPVPSSTSPLWMLNQLRSLSSPHNRFINRRTCLGRPRASATATISRTKSFENRRQSHIPVAKREMAYRTGDAASAQVIELRLVAEQANFDRAGPPRPTAGQKQRQELRLGPRT